MIHSAQRLVERAGAGMPEIVVQDLYKALSYPELYSKYIELVARKPDGARFWRFRIESGIYYAVESNGHILTVLTQAMMRKKKYAMRKASKKLGRNP